MHGQKSIKFFYIRVLHVYIELSMIGYWFRGLCSRDITCISSFKADWVREI